MLYNKSIFGINGGPERLEEFPAEDIYKLKCTERKEKMLMRRILAFVLSVAMVIAFPVMGFAASGSGQMSYDRGGELTPTPTEGTVTTTLSDGTVIETTTEADGTVETVTTKPDKTVDVVVEVSKAAAEAAAKEGKPVKLDVPAGAASYTVKVPASAGKTLVEVPAKNAGAGTVAVDENGNVILTSDGVGSGVVVPVTGDAKVTVENKAVGFTDCTSAFAKRAADWASARGLMVGTTDTTFTPNGTMNTGSLARVINRLTGSSLPVVDNGTAASRAEMIVALWKAVGSPAVTADLSKFTDLEGATADELAAYQWAVANGVIVGTTATTMSPEGSATRAQFATMLMRAVKAQVL